MELDIPHEVLVSVLRNPQLTTPAPSGPQAAVPQPYTPPASPRAWKPTPVPPAPENPRAWGPTDIALQGLMAGVTGLDYLQTRKFLRSPEKYAEANPLLGPHPSNTKLTAGVLAALAGHTAVAHFLPPPARSIWQLLGLGAESAAVRHNWKNGVRIGIGSKF